MTGGFARYPLGTGHRASRRTRRCGGSAVSARVTERLAALETAVAALTQAQEDSAAALGESVDKLDKQLARAGREQFKANAVAEAQQKSVETMLEQLRDAAAYRERELAQLRERQAEAGAEGRLDVVRRLLPALDGLEEALASGRRLLQRTTDLTRPGARPSFWQRLNPARRAARAREATVFQAIAAWLEGLTFVQERLLEALAAIDVVPIATEGRAFDPHRHVAIETVPATTDAGPGTIVREHRRGYIRGDTVLRYAEVVVARTAVETSL